MRQGCRFPPCGPPGLKGRPSWRRGAEEEGERAAEAAAKPPDAEPGGGDADAAGSGKARKATAGSCRAVGRAVPASRVDGLRLGCWQGMSKGKAAGRWGLEGGRERLAAPLQLGRTHHQHGSPRTAGPTGREWGTDGEATGKTRRRGKGGRESFPMVGKFFSMVGKIGAVFPMIEKIFRQFSNDWKKFSNQKHEWAGLTKNVFWLLLASKIDI